MEQESKVQGSYAGKDVFVVNRRSFFGVLLGVGTAGMGALLAIPGTSLRLISTLCKIQEHMVSSWRHGQVFESIAARADTSFLAASGWLA